jgi:hypothetical protein
MTLDGIVLTPQLIKSHLLKAGLKDEHRINAFLSLEDKQDVKLMYDLITSIATLPPATALDTPGEQQAQTILHLLGHLYITSPL